MFCATRWVEDQAIADRALIVWESIRKTVKFWEALPKSKRPQNNSYNVVLEHCNDPLVPAKLHFFSFIAGILKKYLIVFQSDYPMLPFVRDELEKIVRQLIRLVYKRSTVNEAGNIVKLLKKGWLENKKIILRILMLEQQPRHAWKRHKSP